MWDTLIHKWFRVPYRLHVRRSQRVRRARATVVLLHGIGGNGDMWHKLVDRMPDDIRVVTVDLLGFGESPKPHWQVYDAKVQVKSLIATFIQLRLRGKIILVGHSLGALVAVEFAKQFSSHVASLVLVSPPLYKPDDGVRQLLPPPDKALRKLFNSASKYPETSLRLMQFATRYSLINPNFLVTRDNYPMFLSALEACVVNQTTYKSIRAVTLPIEIVYGRFDPFVVGKNMKSVVRENDNVTVYAVNASHEISTLFINKTVRAIDVAAGAPRRRTKQG